MVRLAKVVILAVRILADVSDVEFGIQPVNWCVDRMVGGPA